MDYHLAHNFSHGQEKLSAVLATLNLLAFVCHPVRDLGGRAWRVARRELVTRQGFFHCLRALASHPVFPSWDHLLETLAFMRPPRLGPCTAGAKKCHPTRHDNCVRP